MKVVELLRRHEIETCTTGLQVALEDATASRTHEGAQACLAHAILCAQELLEGLRNVHADACNGPLDT